MISVGTKVKLAIWMDAHSLVRNKTTDDSWNIVEQVRDGVFNSGMLFGMLYTRLEVVTGVAEGRADSFIVDGSKHSLSNMFIENK